MKTNATGVAPTPAVSELLSLTHRLLDAVVAGNWKAYRELVAVDITCFEPEARGQLVEGLAFHEFYFQLPVVPLSGLDQPKKPVTTTLVSPVVRMLSETVGLVAYIRLTQTLDDAGRPVTRSCEETRLWNKQDGRWQHIHFHRSVPT